MKKTLLVAGTLIFMACGGSKTAVQPTMEQLATNYTAATVDQLNQGKMLFEKGCDMCHGLEKSFGVANDKLDNVVPVMVGKANEKAGQKLISEEGGQSILHYLKALNANK